MGGIKNTAGLKQSKPGGSQFSLCLCSENRPAASVLTVELMRALAFVVAH